MLERETADQNAICTNDNARLDIEEAYKSHEAIKKSKISLAHFGN